VKHLVLLYIGVAKQKNTNMLQPKDIVKIQEVKTFFKNSWTQPEFFVKHLELFNFKKSSALFSSVKTSGVPFWDLMKTLLTLPFVGVKNIKGLSSNRFAPKTDGEKDVYYRALGNQKVNWRRLLLLFVGRYLSFDKELATPKDEFKCLIFDDTDIPKTGKKVEGVSKIFNHVTKRYIFGFKLLLAGYWNGSVFIPVDFSIHRECKETKKKYGLTIKQRKKQKKTQRSLKSPAYKRFEELNLKKTDMILAMFKRVNKLKIEVDYILFDSWFTSIKLIKALRAVNKNIHIVGMYKYNSQVVMGEKAMSIRNLRKYKKKISRSRAMNLYYFAYIGEIDGVKVKLFLTKRGTNGAWHTVLSTDTSLTFTKAMKLYNTRWTIEVFFKEAKQLLGLGKCQSTNFDVQIAQTTITMIQYLMLSLKHRMEAYETIGGMFKDVNQDFIEHKLNERILALIGEILSVLELIIEDLDFNHVISQLMQNSEMLAFAQSVHQPEKISKLAA
jgi:hypothetical protein